MATWKHNRYLMKKRYRTESYVSTLTDPEKIDYYNNLIAFWKSVKKHGTANKRRASINIGLFEYQLQLLQKGAEA